MRISIRSLLLLLFIVTLPFAGIYNRYNGKRQLARFLESTLEDSDRTIGNARWSYQLDGWYDYIQPAENRYHGPMWVRRLFGNDACAFIKRASIQIKSQDHASKASRLIGNSDSLRGLEELHIFVDGGIAFDCKCLAGLDDVRSLKISGLKLSESDFRAIADIEDLEILLLSGSHFKSEEMKPLKSSKYLAWIKVSSKIGLSSEVKSIRTLLPNVYVSFDSRVTENQPQVLAK